MGMMVPADPTQVTGNEGMCPACGHAAAHVPAWRVEVWLRDKLGMRPAAVRCATGGDDGPLDTFSQCPCTDTAHAAATTPGYYQAECL